MLKSIFFKSAFIFLVVGLMISSCDKDYVDINTDPYAVNSVDPGLLLANAQIAYRGNWTSEHTIVQHFVSPYNTGATLNFNFNADIDGVSNGAWSSAYPETIKSLEQALQILSDDANLSKTNLRSMVRIWRVHEFMGLVDNYGYVPYSEAGRGANENLFFPKYDKDELIYEDLYKELKSAIGDLNASGEYVSADLFYGANSNSITRTNGASDQVEKWKKLGYSLLLRLGMRYSKVDAGKAESIAKEAFDGGVMASNADNAMIFYDGQLFTQADNAQLRDFSQFNYVAEPFVDHLKKTHDPRAKYMIATFDNPGNVSGDHDPDTVLENQFGVPIGVTDGQIASGAPYRGVRGAGLNYSQLNIWSLASPGAPGFYVTYSQTCLLLAEMAKRGWIPGGDAVAKTYYESGIRADMDIYSLYPSADPISETAVNSYLNEPDVLYNSGKALELINVAYWIVNISNGMEAFANFRRSGYPDLQPNLFNDNLNGGFVRRMSYPDREASANGENYEAASAAMGGDKLTSRVFWDK